MKIVLATGIYSPDIGGPATYVKELAGQMVAEGEEVFVVTYGDEDWGLGIGDWGFFVSRFLRLTSYALRPSPISHLTSQQALCSEQLESWSVLRVAKNGGPLWRWWRYAKVLRNVGQDADVVIAFSSVSCGVPLWMSRLKKPRRILRLGGDFLWERYTDAGGTKGLRDWYEIRVSVFRYSLFVSRWIMRRLLRTFHHIVFSTRFQQEIYEKQYSQLPVHSVIENALPEGKPALHQAHDPFRLLYLGRFVAFKNLLSLLRALMVMPKMTLTLVGSGPMEASLRMHVQECALQNRVMFLPPQSGEAKRRMFAEQDLLLLPSITEISPNTALEARSCGLPVLLSSVTGLSASLTQGMLVRDMQTSEQIIAAVKEAQLHYEALAMDAASKPCKRGWKEVAQEWRTLLSSAQ